VTGKKAVIRVFLDEGVPRAVGRVFTSHGHEVIYLDEAIATGSPDPLVAAVSEANDAILVALDGDMKKLAARRGVGQRRFRKLSLIKLNCRETRAAERIEQGMSLIEHEWNIAQEKKDRRLFLTVGDDVFRTHR